MKCTKCNQEIKLEIKPDANLEGANLEGANLEGAKTRLCIINFSLSEYNQAKQFIEGIKK